MGKPTGFLEYDREVSKAVKPHERIKNFNEFHTPLSRDHQQEQGSQMYGMRCAVLPVGYDLNGDDKRMSPS